MKLIGAKLMKANAMLRDLALRCLPNCNLLVRELELRVCFNSLFRCASSEEETFSSQPNFLSRKRRGVPKIPKLDITGERRAEKFSISTRVQEGGLQWWSKRSNGPKELTYSNCHL